MFAEVTYFQLDLSGRGYPRMFIGLYVEYLST